MESLFAFITSTLSTVAMLAAAAVTATPPLDASKFSDAQFKGGIIPIVAAHHSFGSAVDATGALHFTEYTRGRILKYNPIAQSAAPLAVSASKAYALAITSDGSRYLTIDGDAKLGAVRVITAQGVVKDVVSNINRPRGISIGSDSRIYVALESDNKLIRFDPTTQKSDDALTGVNAPQAVIERKGVLYWLERGTFSPQGEPLTPGKIRMKESSGITRTLVDGIWNAKSMIARADGGLIFVSEANKMHQGNSGYIGLYVPEKNEISLIRGGLDFPQSVTLHDAHLYTTLSRDNLLVAMTDDVTHPWPNIETSALYEGVVTENEEEGTDPFFIAIEGASTPLTGGIKDGAVGVVRGWFKLPITEVSIDKKEIPYGTIDTPTAGVFKTPTVTCKRESGAACGVIIIPERKRLNARWPLWYDAKKREWPQRNFDESPVAYWFYIDTNPQKETANKTWSQMAPSLQRLIQRHHEGLFLRKPKTYDEVVAWFANVSSNSLDCKAVSEAFLSTEEWKKVASGLNDEQTVKTLYRGLLGIEADAVSMARPLDMHKKGESWSTIASDLMKTTQYQSLCVKDWY